MKSSTTAKIGDLVDDVESWNPASSSASGDFVYVDLSSVDQEQKQITDARRVPCADAPSRARQLIRTGDVLVSTVRPNLNGVAIVPSDLDGATGSTGFCVLRPHASNLAGNYLFHWVKSPSFIQAMTRLATGQSYPAVSDRIIKESTLPLPPLSEQKRIAAVLDAADALRAKRRAALAQLDQLTQAIFIEMFGDPERNPRGFPRATLGELIEFKGGSQPPRSTFTYEPSPDAIRLVQIRDFRTDEFKTYIPRNLARRLFTAEDVMIGRYGPPVFQIFRGLSGSYNVALMKAVPRKNVTSDFVFYLLQEPRLHGHVVANSERTAGQSGVNLDLLEKYPAYVPPMELQHEFTRRVATANALVAQSKNSMQALDSLFASLQHRAFRGEL